jgi:hypothetical protein
MLGLVERGKGTWRGVLVKLDCLEHVTWELVYLVWSRVEMVS